MSYPMVRLLSVISIMLAAIAVIIGTQAFSEKNCLTAWYVDDSVVCKECVADYGQECLDCNSTRCNNCTTGYFMYTVDNEASGVVAANETRCRSCPEVFGAACLICDEIGCSNLTEISTIINEDGEEVAVFISTSEEDGTAVI